MVGEIVYHRDSGGNAADLLATADPQETTDGASDGGHVQAQRHRRPHHAHQVFVVVDSGHVGVDGADPRAARAPAPAWSARHSSGRHLECPRRARSRTAIGLHRTAGRLRHLHGAGRCRAHQQLAVRRDQRHELAERRLDSGLVGERCPRDRTRPTSRSPLRAVVEELGSLVEEGGVVFVALHHEGVALAQAPRLAEVQGHAAD